MAKSRRELPHLYYPRANSVRVINSHNFGNVDADAADYFARREALGGDFASAGYTAAQAKGFFNDWYVASKDLGLWPKLTEVYWLIGGTFAGLMAKGKYVTNPVMVNEGFGPEDYTADGPGAGVTGDNASRINITYRFPSSTNICASLYKTVQGPGVNRIDFSPGFSFAASGRYFFERNGQVHFYENVGRLNLPGAAGFRVAKVASGTMRGFVNGIFQAEDTTIVGLTAPDRDGGIFGWGFSASDSTLAFAHIGTDLTDTQVADLSSATNALMTALGANVY